MPWDALFTQMRSCQGCALCKTRKNVVPGEGDVHAPLMLVGEGPGAQEDASGRPFVGAAGQLLNHMLSLMDIPREKVYIANIVKCRPPGNRAPLPQEMDACLPFLRAQTRLIRPRIIVCMGATAAGKLIDANLRITRDRGIWVQRKGFYLMPTFHPAAVLRDKAKQPLMANDLGLVVEKLRELSLLPSSGG